MTIRVHIIFLMVSILFFVFMIARYLIHIRRKGKNKYCILIGESLWSRSYRYCIRLFGIRLYMEWIEKNYEIYYPDNEEMVREKTMKTVVMNVLLSMLILVLSFLVQQTILLAVTTGIVIIILNNYQLHIKIAKEELKLLRQFDEYLSEIRHYYYRYQTIEDTIFESLIDRKAPLAYHIQRINDVLISDDIENEAASYKRVAPNKYLRLFLSICILIQTYGDEGENQKSVFLKNILALKQDLQEEILKRDKLLYKLAGYVPMAVLPMCFLQSIRSWGISMIDNLREFYDGMIGTILAVIIIVVTVIVYLLLIEIRHLKACSIKEHKFLERVERIPLIQRLLDQYEYRYYSKLERINYMLRMIGESLTAKKFILKRWMIAGLTSMLSVMVMIYVHDSSRNLILNNTNNFIQETGSVSLLQKDTIIDAMKEYTKKYIHNDKITCIEIEECIRMDDSIHNDQVIKIISEEIYHRIVKYQNEFFHWYELLLCIALAIISYYVPYLHLQYQKHLVQMDMEDEVIQFQTILLMMKDIKRIGVIDMLEKMEEYAVIFHKSIATCINNFSMGDMLALQRLKEEEKFPMFHHLIDRLMLCDKISMHKAFDDLWEERVGNQQKRRLDNEKLLSKKILKAMIIAWIPFVMVIMLYLIIPFVSESVYNYMEYQVQIENEQ